MGRTKVTFSTLRLSALNDLMVGLHSLPDVTLFLSGFTKVPHRTLDQFDKAYPALFQAWRI